MKNYIRFFIALILLVSGAAADLQESRPVGPGVTFHHEVRDAVPWQIFVLEIDIDNSWLDLESVKADDDLHAFEKTSGMARRNDREAHRIIGAINADFFEADGTPTGAQVAQGELLQRPGSLPVLGYSPDKDFVIDVVGFQGILISAEDSTHAIQGINETRGDNKLIIYNRYFGTSTHTNYWGTEIVSKYVISPVLNDTVLLKVVAKDSIMAAGHGNNAIPADGLVLSGHGTAQDFLNESISIGDTIRMLLQLPPTHIPIKELVGGHPQIICDGVKCVPGGSFSSDRHPRTAVGLNQDSTKIYFVVVDGRQTGYSVGMSLYELADYMLEWGVYQAINLDGGGSSSMVVRNAIVNSPSDASGERRVANALLLVSAAPTSALNHLRIQPRKVYLLTDTQAQFAGEGFDEFYNPVDISSEVIQWQCDPSVGSVDNNGMLTTAADTGNGFIYAAIGEVIDSAAVFITDIASIELEPNPIILETEQQQQVLMEARDTYGNILTLADSEYDWQVTGNIGTISESGLFTATAAGSGEIIAGYRAVAGTTAVSVGAAATVVFDSFDDVSAWSLDGLRIDLDNCHLNTDQTIKFSDPSSARLDYALTTGGTSTLYMNCSIPVSGTPDAIGLYVYGDARGHWLRGEFQDSDGEKFLVNSTDAEHGIDWINRWEYLEVRMTDAIPSWANPSAVLNYPITWNRIYLAETVDSLKDQGTIYLDDFSAHYIEIAIDAEGAQTPTDFRLVKNYPNPFNNRTNFKIALERRGNVIFTFYDLTGKAVDKLLLFNSTRGVRTVSWKPGSLPSGVYFYKIELDRQSVRGKCLFLK